VSGFDLFSAALVGHAPNLEKTSMQTGCQSYPLLNTAIIARKESRKTIQ
jgi:hypothetical protein